MSAVGLIGTIAAVCTTGAFLPQIIKVRKQGGEDLSYLMLFVYLSGVFLWLIYGLILHAQAVIWANVVASFLLLIVIIFKTSVPARRMGRRARLGVDMDEVIADAFSHHLTMYNQEVGANVTVEEVREKGLDGAIPPHHRELFEELAHREKFFADLDVIEGSQAGLQMLSEHFDVFIASAAMEVPGSFHDKFRWLQTHFPFIPSSRIVFCGHKAIVDADYLIDDSVRHFKGFRGKGILFTAPHNAHEAAERRANNWAEVLRLLAKEERISSFSTSSELSLISCDTASQTAVS